MILQEQIEKNGKDAVMKLRRMRLSQGNFFMINVNSLPDYHCYLEFPDGVIKFAVSESHSRDFKIIRVLDSHESSDLRNKLGLEPINR